jgi:CheY-like chemotaxis protein
VEVAYNGKQAVEAAQGFEPQLVVLDVDMPVMDGCEAASKLRRVALARMFAYPRHHKRDRHGRRRRVVRPCAS